MINRYAVLALGVILSAIASYIFWFSFKLGLDFSKDPALWGTFGDYLGGTINPVLSFLSLILLIKSVTLQNEANKDLRNELKENEKTEQQKAATSLFFSMIQSQREMYQGFKIRCDNGVKFLYATEAVIYMEDRIEEMRGDGKGDQEILNYLSEKDNHEQIYGLLRSFYVTVQVISERLSNESGFDEISRKEFFRTLINFTDFAHIRLLILAIQFMNLPSSRYLRANMDFTHVLQDVGLGYDPY